jgi:hypothetical protein
MKSARLRTIRLQMLPRSKVIKLMNLLSSASKKGISVVTFAVGLWTLSPLVAAHHSFAMFDAKKSVELHGTVREWQFTNPHAYLQLVVPKADGTSTEWTIEFNGVHYILRQGWRMNTMKPGDKVVVLCHPLRNGRPGGTILSVTLPNGKVMRDRQL